MAPLYAVRSNNDTDLTNLPETLEFSLAGTRFAMTHQGELRSGDSRSLLILLDNDPCRA
jgi:predicted phosphodiesterase